MTEPVPTRREKNRLILSQVVVALLVIGVAWYVVAHLMVTATVHVVTTAP